MKARGVSRLTLAAGEVMRLAGLAGVEVACESGHVWITEEREFHDLWLGAGQSVRLANDGLAILEATQAARVRLIPPFSTC